MIFQPVPRGAKLLGLMMGLKFVGFDGEVSGLTDRGARLPILSRKPLEPAELLRGARTLTFGRMPLDPPPTLPPLIGMVLSFH